MATTQRMTAIGLLAGVAVLGIIGRAHAQRESPGPGREQRPEARGIVKSIDLGVRTITLAAAAQRGAAADAAADESFALAPDVEVVLGGSGYIGRSGLFRELKLADITAGTTVSLTLSSDRTKVEGIVAEEPTVRGVIQKSVDASTKTLTIGGAGADGRREPAAQPMTFTLADDAEIAVDDGRGRRYSVREGQISDLAAGASVTLWLTLDRKQVRGVLAEGPLLAGLVKSTSPATRTVTISLGQPGARDGSGGEERIVAVADNGTILLDDGKGRRLSVREGKLADVPTGAAVALKMSPDQSRAMQVRVEGPSFTGILKAADAGQGTITIAFPPKGRGDPTEEKTFTVAKDARILSEGFAAPLANLHPQGNGPIIQVRLSLDLKQAQSIIAQQPRAR